MRDDVVVIGGGLAGSEAAWQAAERGARVTLYEMRPKQGTAAHKTDRLAEIVCSKMPRHFTVKTCGLSRMRCCGITPVDL